MTIEICSLGGYNEVGKNMTAIKINEEVIICDMGIDIPAIMEIEKDRSEVTKNDMIKAGAIANDYEIEDWKSKVKAIVIGHAHLDHLAGAQYLAADYNCPIIGTPFTIEVLNVILEDERSALPNPCKVVQPNGKIKITEDITVELINITHSTAQCSIIAIHSPEGIILYANDFKLDNTPTFGEPPNYKRLEQLAKKGIKLLIMDCLYSSTEGKTESETVAKEKLQQVLMKQNNAGKAIFVTTFSSNIARIKNTMDIAKKLKRQPVLIGRTMIKYAQAAQYVEIANIINYAEIGKYRSQVERLLKKVEKERERYLVICTGCQGEQNSVLDRIANKALHFKFKPGDHIIFSCQTIPVPETIKNRKTLEDKLSKLSVNMFFNVHVSGHLRRGDMKEFIEMLQPEFLIPAGGEDKMKQSFLTLAEELNYKKDKNIFLL